MGNIIEQGAFERFSDFKLNEARSAVSEYTQFGYRKTTVFISHKHNELEDLKGVLGFLESEFNVKTYIDSQDPSMPRTTSDTTAKNLKDRIKKCDKFILLATNGAIESKWCNWELGFGDAHKFEQNIALFPMKPKGEYDFNYRGNEYLSLYPYICYEDGTQKYNDGQLITKGYYIVERKDKTNYYQPLSTWFAKR